MTQYNCPICSSEDITFPVGPKDAKILIIGSKPEKDDLKRGRVFSGALGTILRNEFAYRGIDVRQFRMISLHIHEINTKSKQRSECLKYSAAEVIKEAKGKALIILIGTEATKHFLNKGAESVNGLQVPCDYFSAPVFCLENPGVMVARGGVIGEVRSAIRKISDHIEKSGLLK